MAAMPLENVLLSVFVGIWGQSSSAIATFAMVCLGRNCRGQCKKTRYQRWAVSFADQLGDRLMALSVMGCKLQFFMGSFFCGGYSYGASYFCLVRPFLKQLCTVVTMALGPAVTPSHCGSSLLISYALLVYDGKAPCKEFGGGSFYIMPVVTLSHHQTPFKLWVLFEKDSQFERCLIGSALFISDS